MNLRVREKLWLLYAAIDTKFEQQFGSRMRDMTFTRIVNYLHEPKDASSLAVTRILFGLAMVFDIPDERGRAAMDKRWGKHTCHFPLLPFLAALPMPYMAAVYAALWLGAIGIMLGYKFRVTAPLFAACYWYLFLIEKSYWNNHSYLFGLFGFLLALTQANCYWSLDAYLEPALSKPDVPYWNYFLLKYQFFILYFMAGLKKSTAEWLTGYSVQKLSEHWVFWPFRLFLTVAQTDQLVVHWFVFVFDLTVAVWMMWRRTRRVAIFFCALFNLMNSRLFRIGMFPWVCLATMPLFYPFDWPKTALLYLKQKYVIFKRQIENILNRIKRKFLKAKIVGDERKENDDTMSSHNGDKSHELIDSDDKIESDDKVDTSDTSDSGHKDDSGDTLCVYNKAIKELTFMRYDLVKDNISYEDSAEKTVKEIQQSNLVVEPLEKPDIDDKFDEKYTEATELPDLGKKLTTCFVFFYVLTQAFLPYSHFITQGYNNWTNGLYGYSWDMMVHTWDTNSVIVNVVDNDYHREFYMDPTEYVPNDRWTRHGDMVYQFAHCLKEILTKTCDRGCVPQISKNISVYIDVWCSMNGRFTQRMFDPKVDLLKATWSPFKRIPYLMPLLDEALHWRSDLADIREEIYGWNPNSEVIFLADFPGYVHEKYIPIELKNVTLSVLQGLVLYETEVTKHQIGHSYQLTGGNRFEVESGAFHKVLNIGQTPAYYMYTYLYNTENNIDSDKKENKPKLPIVSELYKRLRSMVNFVDVVGRSLFDMFFFKQCQ